MRWIHPVGWPNYNLPALDATGAPVTINAKTVELSASRIYDGSVESARQ